VRRLLYPLAGAVLALLLWLGVTVPLALRVMHIDPMPPTASVPPTPAFDPARPTAALLLSQAGTEITDFLAPWAILAESGAFNVVAVAPTADPVPTSGRLGIVPQQTFAQFDAAHPEGAAVIVVPNILDPENPVIGTWLRARHERGSVVASICEGARVPAHNGLFDGHAATTHFVVLEDLRATHPRVRWQTDVRYVDDGTVVSSAGITAGIDAALHLVDRFAGRATAERTAAALHLPPMTGPAVASPRLTPALLSTGVINGAFSWPKTRVALQMADGVDELAAAAVLDTYPRTFATVVRSVAPGAAPVVSRHWLLFVPISAPDSGDDIVIQPDASTDHFFAFDRVLADIAHRYDGPTAALAAAQLEYAADRLPPDAPSRRLAPYLLLIAVIAAGAILGTAIGRWRSVESVVLRKRSPA
jgi:transcriptional regulator GlxA family with amidase domain